MENFSENQPQQPQQPEQQGSFQPQPEQPQYQQPVQAQPQYQYRPGGPSWKPTVPNAVAVLVLGILSIVTSCWFVGLILGIVGLALSGKGRQAYLAAPDAYTGYGMLNAGRVMSIIGICIGGLYILYIIVLVGIVGVGFGVLSELGDALSQAGY
ncbi:CCC motif membrane protein [uncultured Rikenella sp.]|uniref:CCC motif membrane protein n=1 Tax=uncultured Rikenella sp. TaxID=368003 RepID=UPI00262AF666|nr:CCC motif membrane protein [uncultured Rikenella sp.]